MVKVAYRDVSESITNKDLNGSKTLQFSFASETPHRRMDWEAWEIVEEVLDCRSDAIMGDRLESGLIQFLWNHDRDAVRGVISSIDWREGKGYATARLSRSPAAEELYANVEDGIIKGISVGYRVNKYEVISEAVWENSGWDAKLISPKKVRAIEWEIFEISAVSIPADATVGIGRSDSDIPLNLRQLIQRVGVDRLKKEIANMTDPTVQDVRRSQEYMELDEKYRASQSELTKLRKESGDLSAQVLTLQGEAAKHKSEALIGQKYAKLRSDAEELVRATKLPAHEFDALFARSAADMIGVTEPMAELRAIELVVEMASKRSAALNLKPSAVPAEMPKDIAPTAEKSASETAIAGYESAWRP